MKSRECVPYAPILIESMRSLGYSFSSAIADLIDNSISAHAKNINIYTIMSKNPQLIILDDGDGMDENKLYEAMRYGSKNPSDEREEDDLGRFGLGLKSASLSQCRKFYVVSKQKEKINCYSWDLDYVINKGTWSLKNLDKEEIDKLPKIDLLKSETNGTYILMEEFDRMKNSSKNLNNTFNENVSDMLSHVALVFHRYMDDGLNIFINNSPIEPRDPFLSYLPATQKKLEQSLYINKKRITLKPFILPHPSKLKDEDFKKLGGRENIRNEQGFYVYRNKRLIIWGTWFRLEHKDELNKLARVRVDIPNTLDDIWEIDIKKSTATLPDIVKSNMYSAIFEAVRNSEHVYTYKGKKEKLDSNLMCVWERTKLRDGYDYSINRDLPQIKLLQESLDDDQYKLLNVIFNSIEVSLPIHSLYVDMAKEKIEDHDEEEQKIFDDLKQNIDYLKANGKDLKAYLEMFEKMEIYAKSKKTMDLILEELKKCQ